MKQRTIHILAICLLILFNGISNAQNSICKHDLVEKFFPKAKQLEPWQSKDVIATYIGNELYDYIDGGAEIYFEFGFNFVKVQEYILGEESITLEIYCFDNLKGAFGIYSINRDITSPVIDIGNEGIETDYQISFWHNNYYVLLQTYNPTPEIKSEMRKYAKFVSSQIGKKIDPPDIVNFLPTKNKVPRSERFVMGNYGISNQHFFSEENIFELEKGGEGIFADYVSDSNKFTIFIVRYNDNIKPKSTFNKLKELYKDSPLIEGIDNKLDSGFVSKNNEGNYDAVKIKGNFIALVLNSIDKDTSVNMIKLIDERIQTK